ncbi:MAG: hypothetical protein J0M12_07190 [Deltaproteobacteria bacterium]|nr:hypothetical protein [Deltaproteobacteria bacterium]
MSDAAPSRFWTYLFVVTFSAIIVALGAHELHGHFLRRGAQQVNVKELVRELKGDPADMRASMARKEVPPESEAQQENGEHAENPKFKDFSSIIEKIAP